jgi:hypothetical protein
VRKPIVEVLTFPGCPNAEPAVALVTRVVDDLGISADIRRVDIPDETAAAEHRFLGSPTVRVDGRDVEPGTDERHGYALSCRVYRTASGVGALPNEEWLREALASSD